jgi:hypothetical protein
MRHAFVNKVGHSNWTTGSLRAQMHGPGYASVSGPSVQISDVLSRGKKNRVLTPFGSRQTLRFPELAQYGLWLESLVQEALWEEGLQLHSLEYRFEREGLADETVDKIHVDGGYIRSVYSLLGQPTVFMAAKEEQVVSPGQTFVMTAFERARQVRVPCTLHRRPGGNSERALIVCTFISRA